MVTGGLKVTMLDLSNNGAGNEVLFDATGSQANRWLWHNSKVQFRFTAGSVSTQSLTLTSVI